MAVQWFPGHMHLTRQAIAERMDAIDVVIEMLDARLPGSSANPLLAELTRGKPTLKILNKQDLADSARTALWLAHYEGQKQTRALALDAGQRAPARALVAACRQLAPSRRGLSRPMRVLICGIPNVGKSTLINTMTGRRATQTGDEAGITRTEQRIVLEDDFYLWDTPGVLWPRILLEPSGYRLAASGAIGRNAYDEQEVALELVAVLARDYAAALEQRFDIDPDLKLPPEAVLETIARRRGAVARAGRLDLQKAAEILLHDFRMGSLGRISLETPEEFALWREQARQAEALRRQSQEQSSQRGRKGQARDAGP
ncbi:MAG: ribosome biogenesis GTPase YlqF [Betaproteobacteria bacterium]|nr:ribosome biogenesis GTPase YlqF [Betaproteobacteria bacterium]